MKLPGKTSIDFLPFTFFPLEHFYRQLHYQG